MKPIITWIVITNDTHARIVANEGPGKGVYQVSNVPKEFTNGHIADKFTDRPGRTYDRAGNARHNKVPHTDPQVVDAKKFLTGLSKFLTQENAKGSYDRIVLIAEHRALGILRKCLAKPVQQKVYKDLDKDLTHLPLEKLADHLASEIIV